MNVVRRRSFALSFVACAALFVVVGTLSSTPAAAYRPSTTSVLHRAMERAIERASRALKVEATVQMFAADGARRGEPLVERVWIAPPGQLRRETEGDDGVIVELRADGRTVTKTPGQPDKTSKAGVDVLVDLLAPLAPASASADQMLASLKALGINTEVTSFARFDGRVAIVVGSKPWQTDQPQVWFDKETLLPVRVVTFGKGSDGAPQKVDVRYLGWGSPVGGNWYPASIEIWKSDKLVRRSVTQNVDRDGTLDASVFSAR
jgi:outer membrane lipoprotein-sorting protein